MTDILSSALNFSLWLCLLLATRYRWNKSIVFFAFGAFIFLRALEWVTPLEIKMPSHVGHPVNIGLELATLGMVLWFLFNHSRWKRPETN
ncbi:hypothetical protein [Novosphingobium sediminicola]|uniref:Uncharacterized protein n=1 Tax=Novosphingobium sediminicola TaxID=563162 RepID=A0A7W6CEF3_9SPHN|nr:hypothetical protein [Novosphingobium sediminicola]MBB3955004.1 hypothetical protein [Novosphingobium sediminicola]